MKTTVLILLLAASTAAASAQAPAKPAANPAKPAAPAKSAAPAAKATAATSPTVAAVIKAPAGIPQYKGLQKPVFTVALRYQEIKIGTGPVAETNKLYKVLYTGWRAADGVKFDSTDDHPRSPVLGKDGKPVLGADGKPEQGPPEPISFAQGLGTAILGFDQGFTGMRIGGRRRIFIPWQLAYGVRNIPDHGPGHPGIPPRSDLIFDVELVAVTDLPAMPAHPGMMGGMHPMPGGHPMPAVPGTAAKPGASATPPAPAVTPKAAAPEATTTPAPKTP
jgi:peptidylprolyl isomerase